MHISRDNVWHVRDVDVEEKGRQDRSLWDAVLKALQPAPFVVSGGNGETAIANHLHDRADHVSIRQQSQLLASVATVPYGVVGCCEVDKHSSGLLFGRKAMIGSTRV